MSSSASGGASSRGPVKLSDLPEMVARYGQMRRASTNAKSISTPGVSSSRLVGTGQNGFNLTEVDLTPNSPSDEREPTVSPTGGFIAFRSNGADRNGDGTIDSVDANGKYHIWVMNSDGTNQRQLTGLTPTLNGVVGGDVARNQFRPSWSPDGNQLVYADEDTDPASNNAGGTQLFVVNPLGGGAPGQRTFSPGLKQAPAWSPNGLTIAFSSNTDITATPAQGIAGGRSLFSISPDGTGAARLTSGADDSNPSFGVANPGTLYFSSNLDTANGILPTGRRIWALFPGNPGRVQVSDPTLRAKGKATDIDDYPADSSVGGGNIYEQLSFQTNSLIDASDTTPDLNIWSLQNASTSAETSGSAQVLTNILSSPTNFQASLLGSPQNGVASPQSEDTSGDGEPSFGRSSVGTALQIARLFFVSGRRYTPNTNNTLSNPFGGSEASASDLNTGVSHDIWSTSTQDTTPPTLIPQAAGNSLYPVVSPTGVTPFPAPRTYETGLRAGGTVRFGVVLRDTESGIAPGSVTARFSNADDPSPGRFSTIPAKGTNDKGESVVVSAVNEDVATDLFVEQKPAIVNSFVLNVYDDGPASAGGHEQQANARAGDGDFYCEGILPTPDISGDYYIDVSTTDRVGNSLLYDNVWGFSTQPFTRSPGGTSDLFVSDYTVGQRFPQTVGVGFGDLRFLAMVPVESYYLNHPAATTVGKNGKPLDVDDKGLSTGAYSTVSEPVTFGARQFPQGSDPFSPYLRGSNAGVDVWRVLCRGPVPQTLMNAYLPSTTLQIDPTNPNPTPVPVVGATPAPTPSAGATPVATPLPFSQLTRRLAVSKSAIIWAAPYAATAFVGPGTISDSTTQNNLASYLNAGGRLFVSGRDVAFQLSSGGTGSNTFLSNDLGATLAGSDVLQSIRYATASPTDGLLNTSAPGSGFFPGYYGDFANLQFPRLDADNNLNHENDGAGERGLTAIDRTLYGSGNFDVDPLKIVNSGGGTVKAAYTANIGTVALKIERPRSNGLRSRAVFFSFGMESVNRRYRKPANPKDPDQRVALNVRRALAGGILSYLKTTSFSGTVINNSTNLPVGNFLVRLDGSDGSVYFARTDANGNYTFEGLSVDTPNRTRFTVRPYTDANNVTSPPGFFGGVPTFFDLTGGDGGAANVILRVTPAIPGTVTGKVVRVVNKTNVPINNLPVLIRSTAPSPLFPSGGIFSAVTLTDATGSYTFSGVPAAANMEVVFNPDPRPRSQGGDVPDGASLPVFTKSTQYLTRIVPRTGDKTRSGDIIVPTSGVFVVDDILNDTAADESTPIVLAIDPNNGVTPTPTPPPGGGGGGGGTNPTPTPVAPTGTGPTFAVGRSYAISLPYETSANANSRNLFDRSDADATISITDAFNYAPTEGANTLYTVSRFDVNTLTYIQLPDDALLHRGEGYLLTVSKLPQSALPLQLNTRLENATLLPLTQEPNKNQFSVQLSVNTSLSGNTLAGNNLIGFGFDPTQFGSVAWDTTTADPNASSVTVTSGTRTYSLAQAVGNAPIDRLGTRISLLASSLTTIDNTDTTKPSVAKAVNSLSAFGGYFVVAKKDGLRLTFKNPSTAIGAGTTIPANTSFAFTLPYATTPDAAGTVLISSAFAGSTGYTVYAFNVFGQTGARKTVPGSEFIPLSSGDLLKRGVGYVVKTGSTPVMLNTSATNAGLVPFNGPTFEIPLGRNANFPGGLAASARNGYNLIGSPFNPSTTSNISFANNVRVTATVGSKTYTSISIKEAAARGIISNRLYTHDETGNLTPVPLNDQFLRAYRGYFVQVFKDNVKLTLTAPAK